MLNIRFPLHPQLEEFSLHNEEIKRIEAFEIKPKRKGNREDVLFYWSVLLYYVTFVIVLIFVFSGNPNNDFSFLYVLFLSMVMAFVYSLCIILPLISISIIKFLLDLIVPKSILSDKDVYDELTLSMMEKKKKLEQYRIAVINYQREIERLKKDYPLAENVFPIGLNVEDLRYPNFFKKYIKKIITETYLQTLINSVAESDRIEENRANTEWWESLSPYDFEEEVGKWYQRKGYIVRVTNKSNDGGIDVVLIKNNETTYVQCKQWKEQVPVGVVRELYGVMASHGVKNGVVVCLKGGTKGAIDFANSSGISIVTHHDFVKETKPTTKSYESRDIGNYWQYGQYYIIYDAWKVVEDAINTIKTTNYTSRDFFVGLSKYESYYLGVVINKADFHHLSCFDYVIDAENGLVISKPPQLFVSNGNYTIKRKKKRRRWYRRRW